MMLMMHTLVTGVTADSLGMAPVGGKILAGRMRSAHERVSPAKAGDPISSGLPVLVAVTTVTTMMDEREKIL